MKKLGLTLLVFLLSPLSFSEVDLSPQYCEVFNSLNNIDMRAQFGENKVVYQRVCIQNKVQDLSFSDMVDNYTFIKQTLKLDEKQKFLDGLKAFTSKRLKKRALTYTKLPGIKIEKYKMDKLDGCINEKENYIEYDHNATVERRKIRDKEYIDLDDSIPFELFQANNYKLVLQAKSIIKRISLYKKNIKERSEDINLSKEKYKGRVKRESEVNDQLNAIRDRDQYKSNDVINALETKLFAIATKEPWLFDFGRNFTPTTSFFDRDYNLSSVGKKFAKDLPEEVEEDIDFLQDDNYSKFLASHPKIEKHFDSVLKNDEITKDVKETINAKLQDDLNEAYKLCSTDKERLHHFPQLVEEFIKEKLKSATGVADAYRLQGAYCSALKEHPLDEKGLSSWVTTPALVASIGGSVLLLANPVGLIAATAYGLVTLGGATLSIDAGKTFIENYNHIQETYQVQQLGLTDLDHLINAKDERLINIAEGIGETATVGLGPVVRIFRSKDKLKELEKWMEENLEALSQHDNPNAMTNLVDSRHDGTIHDYQDDAERMENIEKREKVRSFNRRWRKSNEKGERNLLNVVAAEYHSKDYLDTLKGVRDDVGETSDEAFEAAEAILKRHNNYRADYKEIIEDGYLNRSMANELKKYKDFTISERTPLEIYLPKIDEKTGKIISGQGDPNRKVTYTDPGVFQEDLEKYEEQFKASFNLTITEETSSLIGKSKLGERLQEQAALRRKISRMKAELDSLPESEMTPRQIELKKQLRIAYKKPSLFPRDAEAAIQEIIEKRSEYKELGRIALNKLSLGQLGRNPMEAPSKLMGKLAVFAGYTTVVGGGGTAAVTSWFDETTQAGSIGALKANFAKTLDVASRSILDATSDEKICARELRGWSFRNACLIPLMKRYLGVELAERKFDPSKSLLTNPVARQKAREYMKFLLRLKVFDGTGEINQLIDDQLPKTAAEVGIDVLNQRINKVVENEINIRRKQLSEKLSKRLSDEERDKLLEEAQKLLSEETQVAYRTQLLTDLINETDPEKREKMLDEINTKYAEIASIAEIADQKAIADSMVEYGNLNADLVYELENFIPDVANDDAILKEFNFLNSPKLGED